MNGKMPSNIKYQIYNKNCIMESLCEIRIDKQVLFMKMFFETMIEILFNFLLLIVYETQDINTYFDIINFGSPCIWYTLLFICCECRELKIKGTSVSLSWVTFWNQSMIWCNLDKYIKKSKISNWMPDFVCDPSLVH